MGWWALLGLLGCPAKHPIPPLAAEQVAVEEALTCEAPRIDLESGTINRKPLTLTFEEIKSEYPCATGESPEGEPYNYGGGVFFLSHDWFYYSFRDTVEIRRSFKGKVTPSVLGLPLEEAIAQVGGELLLTSSNQTFVRQPWGCVRLVALDGKVDEIGIHGTTCEVAAEIWN